MADKGATLNKRVWELFETSGFVTSPNSQDANEYVVSMGKGRPLDLYAEVPALKVKIIGSNKSGKQASSTSTWTGHMNDLEKLRERVGADKALLTATDHELDQSDIDHAKTIGIIIWSEDKLRYFEQLAESIGTYAKYEIIHALGITTKEESDLHKVLAIKINQPDSMGNTEVYAFSLSPERLLKTAVIYRRAQGNADAYQRMLKRSRLPAIGKFLEKTDAILPTDLILHLDDSVGVEELELANVSDKKGKKIPFSNQVNYRPAVLNIPMKYASMEIIDGQHRLYGFVKVPQPIRDSFNLVVIGLKNLSDKQKRTTFVAINDNSRRMDANLVAYLKYTTDDVLCQADSELMAIRVVVELNAQSPFKKTIRLLDTGEERLTLRGLSGYDMKGLLGARGLLRKHNLINDPEEYIRMLRTYFSIFKTTFKKEWNSPDNYLIATNRGITGLLKLLKSILKYEGSFPSDARILEYAKALKVHWDWENKKLQKTYVGSQGWKEFHRDLVDAIKKEKAFRTFQA